MAHYATNRFSYFGQAGMLIAFLGGGLIIGGFASMIPFLGKVNLFESKDSAKVLESLLVPGNAGAFRWSQFITTLFLFFLPALLYAKICHAQPLKHLGFTGFNATKHSTGGTFVLQSLVIVLAMVACLPMVSLMQEFTEMIPWSKGMLQTFKAAEDAYNKQVLVMARMDNLPDYLISLVIIALLPAVFEETFFRGALQNLFSRWFKLPVLAVLLTSIIFSAVHGSYLGFASRLLLGFVLGWFYYRTGNLWLNIFAHFFNNGLTLTVLYFSKKSTGKIDPAAMEEHFPLWGGLISLGLTVALLVIFEKISKPAMDRPGEEVLIPSFNYNNPFDRDIASIGNQKQS